MVNISSFFCFNRVGSFIFECALYTDDGGGGVGSFTTSSPSRLYIYIFFFSTFPLYSIFVIEYFLQLIKQVAAGNESGKIFCLLVVVRTPDKKMSTHLRAYHNFLS